MCGTTGIGAHEVSARLLQDTLQARWEGLLVGLAPVVAATQVAARALGVSPCDGHHCHAEPDGVCYRHYHARARRAAM